MRKFIGRGVCQSCGAKEVIAHSGTYRRCGRCNAKLWKEVSLLQKDNYMVLGLFMEDGIERKGKIMQKVLETRAKILNIVV